MLIIWYIPLVSTHIIYRIISFVHTVKLLYWSRNPKFVSVSLTQLSNISIGQESWIFS